MLQFGILIYFADYRHASIASSITRLSFSALPPHKLTLPDRPKYCGGAFYRVCEHNNFLRLSEKTKVDIYDDGMSDGRAGGMRSTRRRWLGLVLRRNECRVEL